MPLAVGFGVAMARVHLRRRSRAMGTSPLARPLPTRFALARVGGDDRRSRRRTGAGQSTRVGGPRASPSPHGGEVRRAGWPANSEGSRALIVPGAPFPTYLWGETVDEAIQPVAESPWVVRSAVPLAQPGLIRLLDVVEGRLASGARRPITRCPLLAPAGIGFVVVRHDLDSIASSAVPQSLVRSTLEASPGIRTCSQPRTADRRARRPDVARRRRCRRPTAGDRDLRGRRRPRRG